MVNRQTKYIEEHIFISLILAFIGGFLDAYTYILYDKIFANTQTGNIIFFVIYLLEGQFYNAMLRVFPILSFCIAIFITQYLIHNFNNNKKWLHIVLIINIIVTIILGTGLLKPHMVITTCLISFICALLIGTFKKSQGDVFAPTMCTGNLRSLMEFFYQWLVIKNKVAKQTVIKYASIILTFMIGVGVGVILVTYLNVYSMYICTILFFLVLLIIVFEKRLNK